jgi:outer membrane protein
MVRAQAAAPSKVAIIQIQRAILETGDGKKAQAELTAKYQPKKAALEKLQADIQNLQETLRKGSATLSDDAKNKLMRDIDANQTRLKRDNEDFEADVQQDEQKIMNELGQKMMDIIIKHSTQNGFSMVINVSDQNTPVLWADPSADITTDIIKLYDQAHPAGAATSAPAQAKPPVTQQHTAPPASPAKPTTPPPPPAKKQ